MPTGSPAIAKTIGMTDVACFAAGTALPTVTMTSTLSRTNSAAISAKRSVASLRPAIFDRDGAALDPAEFAQPLHKSGSPLAPGRRRARAQEPDSRQLRRLLRARRERPRGRRAAEQADELAPPHAGHGLPPRCRRRSYQAGTARRSRFDASGACRGQGQPVLGADLNCSELRWRRPAPLALLMADSGSGDVPHFAPLAATPRRRLRRRKGG